MRIMKEEGSEKEIRTQLRIAKDKMTHLFERRTLRREGPCFGFNSRERERKLRINLRRESPKRNLPHFIHVMTRPGST